MTLPRGTLDPRLLSRMLRDQCVITRLGTGTNAQGDTITAYTTVATVACMVGMAPPRRPELEAGTEQLVQTDRWGIYLAPSIDARTGDRVQHVPSGRLYDVVQAPPPATYEPVQRLEAVLRPSGG